MDQKFIYITHTLSRTKRKEYENYVVNAIWNRLQTTELKPVSQQYIKYDTGYYLIDLYFPQLNIGIECDEGYHKCQVERDRQRELTIFDVLKQVKNVSEYQPLHVNVTKSYEHIEAQINSHTNTILTGMEQQKKKGCFTSWQEMDPQQYFADRSTITTADDITFRTIAETCNTLFATACLNMQQSYFTPISFKQKYGYNHKLWFPKLAVANKAVSNGWNNVISADGMVIAEFNEAKTWRADGLGVDSDHLRVTFTQVQDPITRSRGYRFVGVFRLTSTERNKYIYSRVAQRFELMKD